MKKRREMGKNHGANIANIHGTIVIHVGNFMKNLQTRRKREVMKVVLSKLVPLIMKDGILQAHLHSPIKIRPTKYLSLKLILAL